MAYVSYTRSFGSQYANQQVQVKSSATGAPVRILASSSGGHISDLGLTQLDASGNLSVFVDSTITPTSSLTAPALAGVSSVVPDGDKGDVVVSGAGTSWSFDPTLAALKNIHTSATGVVGVTASGTLIGPRGEDRSTKVWRGCNQNMRIDVQGFSGGTNVWSSTTRSRHTFNVRFRRVRAVIQCFYPTGTPIVDTLFPSSMNFQVGFERSYTNAVTGIPAGRPLFHFSGSPVAQYVSGSPPATGYLISDVLDLGSYVEAGQAFGLWTTQEITARTGTNVLPYTRTGTNTIQRYQGKVSAAGTSQIDADTARNATSVSSYPVGSSVSEWFTPAMLLVETDAGNVFVGAIGDSIAYGVGEGQAGSGSLGDVLGSALGNAGIIDRAIYETLGYSCFNMGKGSDANRYVVTASNWQYRRALLTIANPTHVINANVHNDMAYALTLSNWAATTAYVKYDVRVASSNIYMALPDGTSGATTPTGTGAAIWDGGVMWAHIIALPASTTHRPAAAVLANMVSIHAQIKAVVPDAKIIAMHPTPDSSSTDAWVTTANQTNALGFGDATSRRGYIRGNITASWGPLQLSGSFDPSIYLEDSYPTQTSKWVVNGSANYVTQDGTHPNSQGYVLAMPAMTASLFT